MNSHNKQPSSSLPPVSPADARSLVACCACADYCPENMNRALDEALRLCGGLRQFIPSGATVLLKPNLLSPRPPEEAVTTHPALVRAVIESCTAAGAGRIWVGDSPAGSHTQEKLWERTGMLEAVRGTGAELKSFDTATMQIPCAGRMLPVPAWYAEVDAIISLPKLKPHLLTGITLGVKNLYGMISGQTKAVYHSFYPDPRTMSGFLTQVFKTFSPVLTIADAVLAMEGDGPANGRPAQAGLLLASTDAVALDSIAAELYGFKAADLPLLTAAATENLGKHRREQINLEGSGVGILARTSLRQGPSRYIRRLPSWLFNYAARLVRLQPRIDQASCSRCGICAKVCSRAAIQPQTLSGIKEYRINAKDCIRCMCCVEACPHRAVSTVSGWFRKKSG